MLFWEWFRTCLSCCVEKPATKRKRPIKVHTRLLAVFSAALLAAQEPQGPTFTQVVTNVVAPVIVKDADGAYVNGLEARDFTLLDNGKPQDIRLDVSFIPISMVVAVQASSNAEVFLPTIKKIGPLLEGLVLGQQGEAAIVAFDHRMQVKQEFTSDGRLFKTALESIKAGSSNHSMIDAVFHATRMLRSRPTTHRRVMLLIAETRDKGSEGRMREALLEAQYSNIIIYTVNINRLLTSLTDKGQPPRWDPIPPAGRPRVASTPQTPTATAQMTGLQGNSMNFTPLFVEIFRQTKAIFFDNPAEVFTKYTGGREYSFINSSTMDRVMTDLGEELHSQYLLSYNPNNQVEGGWHDIKVEVSPKSRNYDIRTRPGYWMASVPNAQ